MIVDALYIHPIKSCAGVAVARARVTPRGLEHDRRWMVTDEEGRFLSQRTLPAMQAIAVAVTAAGLEVTRAGLPPLALPLLWADGARVPFEVWGYHGVAVRHDEGSAWFSRALDRPAQLVCMPDDVERPVKPAYARPGDLVSFADGFPLLVVSRDSLADLNTRSNFRTDVRRFRPNVVVAGAPPWAEDGWRALRIGALTLRLPVGCARCTIPSIDPDTLEITREPLRTLAALRTRDHAVWFGVNAIPDAAGELAVGDPVQVVE